MIVKFANFFDAGGKKKSIFKNKKIYKTGFYKNLFSYIKLKIILK